MVARDPEKSASRVGSTSGEMGVFEGEHDYECEYERGRGAKLAHPTHP